MASAWTSTGFVVLGITNPVFVQVAPPLMLLKTPLKLPTYNVEGVRGSITRALIERVPRPLLMAVQDSPPFVLLNIPASLVPAYTVWLVGIVGSTANAVTLGLVRPELLAVQVAAPSALRKNPPPGVGWNAFTVGKSPDVVVPVT